MSGNYERFGLTPWRVVAFGVALCGALVLGGLSHASPPMLPDAGSTGCDFRRTQVMTVSDSKALGYCNNPKFLVDGAGNAYLAVRSKNTSRFNICLMRTVGRWSVGMSFEQKWLEDRDGVEVSTAPQRPASIAAAADGWIHMVWYGGSEAHPDHQIRYARFATSSKVRIEEELTPFTVPGFGAVVDGDLWQEHPAIAVSLDGTAHIAWEARDPSRMSPDGKPRPGVAYATRSRDGRWSVSGVLDRPSYLEVDESFPSQSRPTILADGSSSIHVFCYGSVKGVQQILYGKVDKDIFSGWKIVSPSPGDQRHCAAAVDREGRLHVVWREGMVEGGAVRGSVSIFYSAMEPDGKWSRALRLNAAQESGSTPSVAASSAGVSVVWVGWKPGAINSEGKIDNDFPSDNSAVEGNLMLAFRPYGSSSFDAPLVIDDGPASYPTWAIGAVGGHDPPPLIWTSGVDSAGASGGAVTLHFGWCEVGPR